MASGKINVNKADINPVTIDPADMPLDVMGLFFFAYRDFVGDADALLERQGFGRAHHRVLYFVNLKPGMPVADLLDILKITKQSLARVLRQLIDNGYIEQKHGRRRPPPAPALRHRKGPPLLRDAVARPRPAASTPPSTASPPTPARSSAASSSAWSSPATAAPSTG